MKRHIINEKKSCENESAILPTETNENNKKSDDTEITKDSWAEDQTKKSYYYDDSYGYEVYNPDDEEDDEE